MTFKLTFENFLLDTLAPRLPWQLSKVGKDPYASTFAVAALSPLLQFLVGAYVHVIREAYICIYMPM